MEYYNLGPWQLRSLNGARVDHTAQLKDKSAKIRNKQIIDATKHLMENKKKKAPGQKLSTYWAKNITAWVEHNALLAEKSSKKRRNQSHLVSNLQP